MGTISSARSVYGLEAVGRATKLGVVGAIKLGDTSSAPNYPDADIFYSVSIESTALSGEAVLNIGSGVLGSLSDVTTEGGDGNDFEGEALPTLTTLYALSIERASDNPLDDAITITPQLGNLPTVVFDETTVGIHSFIFPDGITVSGAEDEALIEFDGNGDKVIITVCGKSS